MLKKLGMQFSNRTHTKMEVKIVLSSNGLLCGNSIANRSELEAL